MNETVKTGGQKCPLCSKPTEHAFRPFCSKRCQQVDLGRWISGKYAIEGDPVDPRPVAPEEEDV